MENKTLRWLALISILIKSALSQDLSWLHLEPVAFFVKLEKLVNEEGWYRQEYRERIESVEAFAEAVERVRRAAIVWMARMAEGRHEFTRGSASIESGDGRTFRKGYTLQGRGGAPKWTVHYGLSL